MGRATGHSSSSVVVVAGEASGDAAGAGLAVAIRRRMPEVALEGIGGSRMAAAGVELVADSAHWGAIGVAEAVVKIPRIWRSLRRLRRRMLLNRPLAVVLIDSGGMNMPFLRMIRDVETKRLYYMPPGSWSRKPRNGALRELVDTIATPFPWSRDLLSGGRARVEWVGHPVVESAQPRLSRAEAYRKYGLEPGRPVVAVAPGSREQEMRYVLPLLARASARLAGRVEKSKARPECRLKPAVPGRGCAGAQFIVPASDPIYEKQISVAFGRFGLQVTVLQGMEYDALQLADVAAVCSGTATLEFACLGIPMVIAYKASALTTAQFVLFRGVIGGQWRAGMPNIIAGRDIVPEFLWRAQPEQIGCELALLLSDTARRERMREDLAEVRRSLGDGRASERTADLLMELIGGPVSQGVRA